MIKRKNKFIQIRADDKTKTSINQSIEKLKEYFTFKTKSEYIEFALKSFLKLLEDDEINLKKISK